MVKGFQDIIYLKKDGVARISINRSSVLNAFRPLTIDELKATFQDAWDDNKVGVVGLGGNGHFCVGGDVKIRGQGGYEDASGSPACR